MKLLLYCTKAKPYLYFGSDLGEDEYGMIYKPQWLLTTDSCFNKDYALNGKIIGECDFEVEEIYSINYSPYIPDEFDYTTSSLKLHELEEKSCLNQQQLFDYLTNDGERYNDDGYAIHIKNLHIFDKPKEIDDYAYYVDKETITTIKKAPQNMMYAYKIEDIWLIKSVLISIYPEYLCKIFNGEKSIEVRKKVLKGMLK